MHILEIPPDTLINAHNPLANLAGGKTKEGRPEVSLQRTDQKGVFEANFFRSKDNELSRESDPAKIILPEEFSEWTGVLCRKIVRLEDYKF